LREARPARTLRDKINEIAAYLKRNASLQVGVDGSMDPRGESQGRADQAPGRLRFELGLRTGRPPLARYRSGDLLVS